MIIALIAPSSTVTPPRAMTILRSHRRRHLVAAPPDDRRSLRSAAGHRLVLAGDQRPCLAADPFARHSDGNRTRTRVIRDHGPPARGTDDHGRALVREVEGGGPPQLEHLVWVDVGEY